MKKYTVVAQSEAQYNVGSGFNFRSEHDDLESARTAAQKLTQHYHDQAQANTPAYGITSNADRWEVRICDENGRFLPDTFHIETGLMSLAGF